ncbi:MAG: hypothetical protein IID51_09770, partial [Proteobacteria bacterium]|nr:hypothetical protein [Pseudomonadota bacterium]
MSHENLESFNPAILKPGSWEPSTAVQETEHNGSEPEPERNGSNDVNPFTARIEGAKPLSVIVDELNEENGADFTEADKVPEAEPDIEPAPSPELEPGPVSFNRLNLMVAKVASKPRDYRLNMGGVPFVGNKKIATDRHM